MKEEKRWIEYEKIGLYKLTERISRGARPGSFPRISARKTRDLDGGGGGREFVRGEKRGGK